MKKILILLTIVVGLTSCPAKHHDDWVTIVKFTREEYAQYVWGMADVDSVQTFQSDFSADGQPVELIYLSDGWWYINVVTVSGFFQRYTALGEMKWEEFNNLPEEEKSPAVSALKDAHSFDNIARIALDRLVTPDCDSYYDVHYLGDYSAVIVQLREIIESGSLDDYRPDYGIKR